MNNTTAVSREVALKQRVVAFSVMPKGKSALARADAECTSAANDPKGIYEVSSKHLEENDYEAPGRTMRAVRVSP